MKTTETNNKTIESLLSVHKIEKLNSFDEIKKLLDFDKLDQDMMPSVLTKIKTVIIIDNMDFNETYLIDIVNEIIDNIQDNKILENVKFYYLDDFDTKVELFKINILADSLTFEQKKEIEKKAIPPSILTINSEDDQVLILREEMLSVFDLEDITEFLTETKMI